LEAKIVPRGTIVLVDTGVGADLRRIAVLFRCDLRFAETIGLLSTSHCHLQQFIFGSFHI
jgi:hypothetical protein